MTQFACPQNIHWEGELLQDLHISLPIVNVLAMDGRRRWLDIEKLVCLLWSFKFLLSVFVIEMHARALMTSVRNKGV